MKKTKLGKHEQSCGDELVMLDIDESKIRSLCKKARKLDEDGVSFPLPPPNLYFEYWDVRKTARERKIIYKMWKLIMEETGLEDSLNDYTYYCLRHTFATYRLFIERPICFWASSRV